MKNKSVKILLASALTVAMSAQVVHAEATSNNDTQALTMSASINLSIAKRMAEAMEKKAKAEKVNVVIYIVGADGRVLVLHRDERSGMAPLEWARNKAITAYQTKKQTKDLSETIKVWRADNISFVPGMAGGIPLVYKGERVGAIGVSGAPLPVDQAIAEEGLKIFDTLTKQ